MCARWGQCYSKCFKSSNGVKHGSFLSPILFVTYMDDLSLLLSHSGFGCHINNTCTNHIFYADDLYLISPSAKYLQCLVDVCGRWSTQNDLLFNVKKSVSMFMESKAFKLSKIPEICVNNVPLTYVNTVKYLGHVLDSKLKDNCDIHQQCSKFYSQANSLIRNFNACSPNVKQF